MFLYHPDDREKTHIIIETWGKFTVFLNRGLIFSVLCWFVVVPFLYLNLRSISRILKKYPDLTNVPGAAPDDDKDSQEYYKSVMFG
jgi:hypothetical protein